VKITALDLSITATGVCLPDGTVSTVRTKTTDGDRRLLVIEDAVRSAVTGADLVVMEALTGNLKGSASVTVGKVHGVVDRLLMRELGIPYAEVSPSTLKKFATGNGNCNKVEMGVSAMERFHLRFKDDNQCDAFWLWQAALVHYGLADVTFPPVQRNALKTVVWP
jgi:Holliday junction resolvasome RuvABC endonuclease subunit